MQNESCESLKVLLASTYSLYTKLWAFHWNLVGTDFAERHGLYGEWKDMLSDHIDTLAERIRQLGDVAPAWISQFAKMTNVKDSKDALMDEGQTAEILYSDFCHMSEGYEAAIEIFEDSDKITSNILQELGAEIQKIRWFLESITHGWSKNTSVEVEVSVGEEEDPTHEAMESEEEESIEEESEPITM